MFDSLQKLLGQSNNARFALMLTLAQAVIICTLEAVVFTMHVKQVGTIQDHINNNATFKNDSSYNDLLANARSISVYHILFILAQIFTFVLCFDALYHENTIQLIALALFTMATFSYSVIQTYQSLTLLDSNSQTKLQMSGTPEEIPYEVAIIILMFFIAVIFTYLSYKLYKEFGWSIYKRIGADMAMRDRYKMYQIFIMLLKFDVFFFVGFTAQFLVLVIVKGEKVYTTVTITTLASIIILIMAFWGVQAERKMFMYFFMLGCVGAEAYIIYRIVDVINRPNDYTGTRIFVTFFLLVCFILGVVTFVIAVLCTRNFNKGLKYHISRQTFAAANGEDISTDPQLYVLENVHRPTKRWSID